MNGKHSSQQILENRLRAAVKAQTPNIKDEILGSIHDHGETAQEKRACRRKRPVWKYAVSFALIAIVAGVAIILPQSVKPAPAAVQGEISSKSPSGKTGLAQQNPFTITAYAAEKGASSQVLNKKFGINLNRLISISGIDCSAFIQESLVGDIYDDLSPLKKENGKQLYAEYLGFNLKCTGNHIKSITYAADRGGFAQIKSLTSQEEDNIVNTIPFFVEEAKEDFEKHKKEILKKDPNYTIPTPNPNYGDGKSIEAALSGSGWALDENSPVEYYGYLPIGNSYTLNYADQDDYTKQYAFRLTMTYTDAEVKVMDKKSMRELDHCSRKKMDGTVITITANYDDGTNTSKQCVLKLDPDTWEFKAVEK